MRLSLHFIALRLTRYSDRQSILTAYSREQGRISLAVPAGNGRSANRMRALVMPMSLVECNVDLRPGREIHAMSGAQLMMPLQSVHTEPAKQMTAMFLGETLAAVLGQSEADPELFDFIARSMQVLDMATGEAVANFHACFLVQLTHLLGIHPDDSHYRPGSVLDMREARWLATPPLHPDYLMGEEAEAAHRVLQMSYDNMAAYRYKPGERARVLDSILAYYAIHYVPLRSLKSLPVLRSLSM